MNSGSSMTTRLYCRSKPPGSKQTSLLSCKLAFWDYRFTHLERVFCGFKAFWKLFFLYFVIGRSETLFKELKEKSICCYAEHIVGEEYCKLLHELFTFQTVFIGTIQSLGYTLLCISCVGKEWLNLEGSLLLRCEVFFLPAAWPLVGGRRMEFAGCV